MLGYVDQKYPKTSQVSSLDSERSRHSAFSRALCRVYLLWKGKEERESGRKGGGVGGGGGGGDENRKGKGKGKGKRKKGRMEGGENRWLFTIARYQPIEEYFLQLDKHAANNSGNSIRLFLLFNMFLSFFYLLQKII